MKAPLLLEALIKELKDRKLPNKVIEQLKELYEVAWRESFAEGQKDERGEFNDE